MILVDSRVGSKELHPYLKESQLVTLDYADFAFTGRGPEGATWAIGIERKAIQDLLACMVDGRFTGVQLPGLISTYNVVYLIIEGLYRFSPRSKELQILVGSDFWRTVKHGNRTYNSKEVLGYINSLQMLAGVYVVRTLTIEDTAIFLQALDHWWNAKDYEDHKSHLTQHRTAYIGKAATPYRKFVAGIPGVGWTMSKDIVSTFKTPKDMVEASLEDWMAIKGIGKTRAANIMEFLTKATE